MVLGSIKIGMLLKLEHKNQYSSKPLCCLISGSMEKPYHLLLKVNKYFGINWLTDVIINDQIYKKKENIVDI